RRAAPRGRSARRRGRTGGGPGQKASETAPVGLLWAFDPYILGQGSCPTRETERAVPAEDLVGTALHSHAGGRLAWGEIFQVQQFGLVGQSLDARTSNRPDLIQRFPSRRTTYEPGRL